MNAPEDRDLRDLFRDLREAEGLRMPSFERTLDRPRASAASPARRLASVLALLLVTIAAAILIARRSDREPRASLYADGRWMLPTDFLLDTPGRELLSLPELPKGDTP